MEKPWAAGGADCSVSRDGTELAVSNMPAVVGSRSRRLVKPGGCVAHAL